MNQEVINEQTMKCSKQAYFVGILFGALAFFYGCLDCPAIFLWMNELRIVLYSLLIVSILFGWHGNAVWYKIGLILWAGCLSGIVLLAIYQISIDEFGNLSPLGIIVGSSLTALMSFAGTLVGRRALMLKQRREQGA